MIEWSMRDGRHFLNISYIIRLHPPEMGELKDKIPIPLKDLAKDIQEILSSLSTDPALRGLLHSK